MIISKVRIVIGKIFSLHEYVVSNSERKVVNLWKRRTSHTSMLPLEIFPLLLALLYSVSIIYLPLLKHRTRRLYRFGRHGKECRGYSLLFHLLSIFDQIQMILCFVNVGHHMSYFLETNQQFPPIVNQNEHLMMSRVIMSKQFYLILLSGAK